MTITISKWSSHYNQFLYSLLFYCEAKSIKLKICSSSKIVANGVLINYKNKKCFLDYSDDLNFIEKSQKYDFYFKRSLHPDYYIGNVKPLNLQVNFSYKPLKLITKMPIEILTNNSSRVELIRAFDYFSLFTNDSHQSKNIENLWSDEIIDNGGRVIFMTRLWDSSRSSDPDEKERREQQNQFRINACRIISKNFTNSITGIYPDYYAKKVAKDVLIDIYKTKKQSYLSELRRSDIGIADDGLKNTPGWKIGEYTMSNKAIISTPVKTIVQQFKQNTNYISLDNRNDYKSLPDRINELKKSKSYLELKENNKNWSEKYLKPCSYIENILKNCN